MLLLARLLLASVFADFVLQSSALAKLKTESFRGLLLHGLAVLLTSAVVGFGYMAPRYLALVMVLSVLHILIDLVKISVDRKLTNGLWPAATFVIDQALHLVAITLLLAMFGYVPAAQVQETTQTILHDARITAIVAIYLGMVAGGSILVRIVVQSFGLSTSDKSGMPQAGAYIGYLERLLLTSLVAANQFGAAGFVLAAKSIARFKQLEDQRFAEYYLIGTLTSSAIAVLAGIVVRAILY